MHRISKVLFVLSILVIAIGFPLVAVHAAPAFAPAHQDAAPVLPSLPDLFETAKNLGGIALLFAALVNVGKHLLPNVFPDGSAPTYTLITQTFVLVGLVVLQVSGGADLIPVIDQNAGVLATILSSVIALAYQLMVARKGHDSVLAGLPVIGTSFSGRVAGEQTIVELAVEAA